MAEWKSELSVGIGDGLIIGPSGVLPVPARPGPADDPLSDLRGWVGILAEAFAGNRFGVFQIISENDQLLLRQVPPA